MSKNWILGAKAGAACLALAAALPLRADPNPEDLYSAVAPSIVALEVENTAGRHFVGSAFLAVQEGLAVTAWHVIHDARKAEARFSDNQRAKVLGVVDKNEKLDLALIKLAATGKRAPISLSPDTPRIGSRVYLVGSPRGFDFSISEGLVSQIRTVDGVRYYQLSCPISPGDSGGPVLNSRGQAIGVVSWRKADAENLGFAIPCPAVARLNATLPLVRWPETLCDSSAPGQQSDPAPLVRAKAPGGAGDAAKAYEDFLQFLSSRAGKRLTVTVRDRTGQESRFNFEVPNPAGN